MKFKSLFLVVFSLSTFFVSAQSNLLNAKTPDQIGKKSEAQMNADNDKPLPYGYVDDRDLLFSRKVWEIIDLDEKVNFPLYYPLDNDLGANRKCLYNVLIDGITEGKITEVYDSSYFTYKKTLKEIQSSFSVTDTTDAGIEQKNAGEAISEEYINTITLKPKDVDGYKIVGVWYFDKRQGELKYRMLGICPVIPDVYTMKDPNAEKEYIELFWVFFPAARDYLHANYAFNDRNSAMPISFDHMLNARRFNAVIYQEENVMGDRQIKNYMKENAQMQLLESERIKTKIRDFEQDMWSY